MADLYASPSVSTLPVSLPHQVSLSNSELRSRRNQGALFTVASLPLQSHEVDVMMRIPTDLQPLFDGKSVMLLKDFSQALQTKGDYGVTPAHKLVRHPKSLNALRKLLKVFPCLESVFFSAFRIPDDEGLTPMHWLVQSSDRLKAFGDLLESSPNLIFALKYTLIKKDRYEETPVHKFIRSEKSLKIIGKIFGVFPKSSSQSVMDLFFQALWILNNEGKTPFHYLEIFPGSLNAFVEFLEIIFKKVDWEVRSQIIHYIQKMLEDSRLNLNFKKEFYKKIKPVVERMSRDLIAAVKEKVSETPDDIAQLIIIFTMSLSLPEESA